jgi:copper transport protein
MTFLVGDAGGAVVRAMLYIVLLLAIGMVVFIARVASPLGAGDARFSVVADSSASRARRVGAWALTLMLPVIALRLVQQAALVADTPEQWMTAVPAVLQTMWGRAWLLQAVVGIAATLTAWSAMRAAIVGMLVAVLAITPSLSGHAVGSPELPIQAVIADSLHVMASGAWLGTLAMLAAAGLPAARRGDHALRAAVIAQMVASFSPVALASAAVLGVTGTFASWLHLDTLDTLWTSRYGQTLLIKLAAIAVVITVGAWNWRRLTPRLRTSEGTGALTRSVTLELVAGLVVVAVTAVLVATPLPGE